MSSVISILLILLISVYSYTLNKKSKEILRQVKEESSNKTLLINELKSERTLLNEDLIKIDKKLETIILKEICDETISTVNLGNNDSLETNLKKIKDKIKGVSKNVQKTIVLEKKVSEI